MAGTGLPPSYIIAILASGQGYLYSYRFQVMMVLASSSIINYNYNFKGKRMLLQFAIQNVATACA